MGLRGVSRPLHNRTALNESSPIFAQVISNFEYSKIQPSPASYDSKVCVKVCVDRPLQIRVSHVNAAHAEASAVDLVVCSSGGGIVAEFPIEKQHFDTRHTSDVGLVVHIAGSKRQYGLPKNTRSAIAEAKRQDPSCVQDKNMTLRLRISLVKRLENGAVSTGVPVGTPTLAMGCLITATNRHQRHRITSAMNPPADRKRPRDEEAGLADLLRESEAMLAAERRRSAAMQTQLVQLQQELSQLRACRS